MILDKARSTLTSPALVKVALGSACVAGAIALLVLGFQMIHFGHFHAHYHFYNTLVTLNLKKVSIFLVSGGALAGVGLFFLKKAVVDRIDHKKKKWNEMSMKQKAVEMTRFSCKMLATLTMLAGIAMIAAGIIYIAYFLPGQPALTHGCMHYLANEALLKGVLAGIVTGSALTAFSLLECARAITHRRKEQAVLDNTPSSPI